LILAERNQTGFWQNETNSAAERGGGAKSTNAQGHIADFLDT
jgi:hypothetical protein